MIHSQNTGTMTKHVGIHNDKKCVIVLQLPEATHEVHIMDTESLPDLYHQNLMEYLMSPEGQAARWFGDVLSRKMLYDGTQALRTFYEKNMIAVVPATSVFLSPRPNTIVPFTQVFPVTTDPLAAQQDPYGLQESQYNQVAAEEQAKLNAGMAEAMAAPEAGFNQHAQNLSSDLIDQNMQIGNNLLAEAQMLEAEAANKRAKAAQYGVLSPVSTSATPVVEPTMVAPTVTGPFVDDVTGKTYKTAGALKGVQTKRANASQG